MVLRTPSSIALPPGSMDEDLGDKIREQAACQD